MSSDPARYRSASGSGSDPKTDWLAWHDAYDSPISSLGRRVAVVRRRLEAIIEERGRELTVLSLCAGDGRDVLGIDHALVPSRVVLVEINQELAARARASSVGIPTVEVRCADASDLETFIDVAPVDVLLLCGVFGNVAPDTVGGIIDRLAGLLSTDGTIIWTRGGSAPDRRAEVRAAFVDRGFEELSFDGAPEPFGVGVSRLRGQAKPLQTKTPLFTFVW